MATPPVPHSPVASTLRQHAWLLVAAAALGGMVHGYVTHQPAPSVTEAQPSTPAQSVSGPDLAVLEGAAMAALSQARTPYREARFLEALQVLSPALLALREGGQDPTSYQELDRFVSQCVLFHGLLAPEVADPFYGRTLYLLEDERLEGPTPVAVLEMQVGGMAVETVAGETLHLSWSEPGALTPLTPFDLRGWGERELDRLKARMSDTAPDRFRLALHCLRTGHPRRVAGLLEEALTLPGAEYLVDQFGPESPGEKVALRAALYGALGRIADPDVPPGELPEEDPQPLPSARADIDREYEEVLLFYRSITPHSESAQEQLAEALRRFRRVLRAYRQLQETAGDPSLQQRIRQVQQFIYDCQKMMTG